MRLKENVRLEMERNHERYMFLKWGRSGIQPFQRGAARRPAFCHQLFWNTRVKTRLGRITGRGSGLLAGLSLSGDDSPYDHEINGLGVLGWGVGGIEGGSGSSGQPVSIYLSRMSSALRS